jgi:DnaJ homolog subfamily B member 4
MELLMNSLYTGTTKRLKITRKQNDGSGRLVPSENVLEVTVKPGWKPGTKIRFPNAGDELVPGQAQTIAFVVEEKPHAIYKREGDDLFTEIDITLVEAFTGFSRDLKTLDGRILKVSSTPGEVIQPGQIKLFSREGMPNQRTGGKGNLRVKLNVKFPKSVSREQIDGIKRLFG